MSIGSVCMPNALVLVEIAAMLQKKNMMSLMNHIQNLGLLHPAPKVHVYR